MRVQLFVLLLATISCSFSVDFDLKGDLRSFLENLIKNFKRIAKRVQFAVVLMLSQEELETWNVSYIPHNNQGFPLINVKEPISPSNRNHFGNFIASRPSGRPNRQHSEQQILQYLPDLLQSYQRNNNGNNPAAIILYSRIAPCINCTNNIIRSVNNLNLTEGVQRFVIFTTDGTNVPDVDIEYCLAQLICSGFTVLQFDHRRDIYERLERSLVDQIHSDGCFSIQLYLLDRLNNSLECCISPTQPTRPTADFINRLMASCYLEVDKLDTCLGKAAKEILGGSCECVNGFVTPSLISTYVKAALDSSQTNLKRYFISHPLNTNCPINTNEPITDQAQLQTYDKNVTYTCIDNRKEGLMCSFWKSNYLTANRDLCSKDHPCGEHGYSYSWCYLDAWSIWRKWDYCCNETCQYGWCNSGSSWQHCTGDIGYVTAGNTMCKEDTPCGLHGKAYSWCYTDYGWEYCCTSSCGLGYGYRWCTAANAWQYCGQYDDGHGLSTIDEEKCLPTHPCGKHGVYNYKYWCHTKHKWNYCCAPGQTISDNCYTTENIRSMQREEELS